MLRQPSCQSTLDPPGIRRTISLLCWRDLKIAYRTPADIAVLLAFFLMVISLFPLAIGPAPNLLRTCAPGIIWVSALLSSLLALPRLFQSDFSDGTLEQLALAPSPLSAILTGKVIAHWLTTGLPIALLAPLACALLQIPSSSLVMASLLLGTPTIAWLGAISAALTIGIRNNALIALVLLPLATPVLVLGTSLSAETSQSPVAAFLLLTASLILSCIAGPIACTQAVRIMLE